MKKQKWMAGILVGLSGLCIADTIAVNGDVPAIMDSAVGVAGNPATYVFDNYEKKFTTGLIVGKNNPNVALIIRNGAKITAETTQWASSYVGEQVGSSNNTLTITGPSSMLNITSQLDTATHGLKVGNTAGFNTLNVFNGATVNAKRIDVGMTGGNSIMVIDNATVNIYDRIYVANAGGANNLFSIRKQGKLYAFASGNMRVEFAGTATNNVVEIKDFGTIVDCGMIVFDGVSNVVAIIDDGLLKARISGNWQNRPKKPTSFHHFGGGFLAWQGVDAILDYKTDIKLWDGTNWIKPTTLAQAEALGWSKTYYATDELALAATGYDGLAGYTVFTGGIRKNPLPPATTCIVLR